jgi:hypothetical protein
MKKQRPNMVADGISHALQTIFDELCQVSLTPSPLVILSCVNSKLALSFSPFQNLKFKTGRSSHLQTKWEPESMFI